MNFVYSWEAMNSQLVDSEVCLSLFSFAFELSLSSFTFLLSPGLSLDPDLGSAVQERHGDQQSAMKMIKGFELLWDEEAEMSQRDKYLTGGSREYWARLFSVVLSDTTRSKEQKSKHRKFHLNITKFFLLLSGWSNSWRGYIERLWSHHPGRYQLWPWVTVLADAALSGGWTGWSPEMPSSLSHSVTLLELAQVPQTMVLTNVIMW